MSSGKGTNPAASIHGRLLHIARQRQEKFENLLIRFALERLLYRLAESPDGEHFVLKGALLFILWDGDPHRPTRDIDLSGLRESSADHLAGIFRRLCDQPTGDDCLKFDSSSVTADPIRQEQRYAGLRIRLRATLGKARIPIRVDIGFGDVITPAPEVHDFPTLLPLPPPRLRTYPRVTMVAEKFHAIVELGFANSRMKDFFDLLTLSEKHPFDGRELSTAIAATFRRRRTVLPPRAIRGLSQEFARDPVKQIQWQAFVRKAGLELPLELLEVIERLRSFLLPPTDAARGAVPFDSRWPPGGPWRPCDPVPRRCSP